jgi:ABC-type Fe3+-siderophore transport system permease subunit
MLPRTALENTKWDIILIKEHKNRMILTGLGGIVIVEIYAAVMQHVFQNTKNQVGKGFAILGIYLFVVIYCKHLLPSSHST